MHSCYSPCVTHAPAISLSFTWRVQIMKPLIRTFSAASCHFLCVQIYSRTSYSQITCSHGVPSKQRTNAIQTQRIQKHSKCISFYHTAIRQDSKCTCNVTLRRVRATEYYTTCVCICSLRYPARNAHASYCNLTCPALPHFSTWSHRRYNFRKK
jgi:hypothetical protein